MKNNTATLGDMLAAAATRIKVGSTWQHYKGGVYTVNDFAIMTEDGEVGVIYNRIAGPGFDSREDCRVQFCRPLAEWFDMVPDPTKGGKIACQRFTRVAKVTRYEAVPDEEA